MKNLSPFRRRYPDTWMRDLDQVFEDFFSPNKWEAEFPKSFNLPVDIKEEDDFFLISADIPGTPQDNINIEVKDRVLTISGERSSEKKEEKSGRVHRYERQFGSFSRSFQLPENINADNVQAKYEHGVLEILVPKAEAAKAKTVKIETGKGGLFSSLLGDKAKDVN